MAIYFVAIKYFQIILLVLPPKKKNSKKNKKWEPKRNTYKVEKARGSSPSLELQYHDTFLFIYFENGGIFKRYLYKMLKFKEITSKCDKKIKSFLLQVNPPL